MVCTEALQELLSTYVEANVYDAARIHGSLKEGHVICNAFWPKKTMIICLLGDVEFKT